jgi:Domain of unknown function (DUF4382)
MKRLFVAAAALVVLACSDATTTGGAGRTQVYLTDSPFPYGSIAQVNVYIARIEASASTDTTGLNPQAWVTIATPERTFNLLDFQGGSATLLGEADLPADRYAAVRVVINTGRSSVIRNDGMPAAVHWPISGNLSLYALVGQPLNVTQAGAQIVLDFDVGLTFLDDGSGGFYFSPVIRAVNQAATGTIAGSVTATSIEGDTVPVANAAVSVYVIPRDPPGYGLQYLSRIGTGRTDAQGHYTVAFLPAGAYAVQAADPASPQMQAVLWGASVGVGATTPVNLMLALDTTGTGGGGGGGCGLTDSTGVDSTCSPTGPVTRVAISPAAQTISVGDSAGAIAMTYNAQNMMLTGRAVTWTLGDSSVVSVTQAAYNWILLRGAQSGATTLVATSEGVSDTATVTVR